MYYVQADAEDETIYLVAEGAAHLLHDSHPGSNLAQHKIESYVVNEEEECAKPKRSQHHPPPQGLVESEPGDDKRFVHCPLSSEPTISRNNCSSDALRGVRA